MARYEIPLEVVCIVITTEKGEAAIDRYVDLTEEQGKELSTTPGMTREQVELALLGAHLRTGMGAHRLDGWADLDEGDIDIRVDYIDRM